MLYILIQQFTALTDSKRHKFYATYFLDEDIKF